MSQNAAQQVNFPLEGYFLHVNGQNQGPLSQEKVLERFRNGEIQRTTPLWFPSLANWITVADLPELDRRKLESTEIEIPKKDKPDAIILQLKGHAIPLRPQSIKALIMAEDFRRTDQVYDEDAKDWIRSDQHPIIRLYYSMPPPPSGPLNLGGTPLTTTPTSEKAAEKPAEKPLKKKISKRTKIIVGVVMLLAALGGGAYYFQFLKF